MIRQATVSTPAEAVPPADAQVLDALRDLPGLVHACVLDGDRVVAEAGRTDGDGGTAALLVAWARRASAVSSARSRRLEDVIVSTVSSDHLVRSIPGAGGLWVGIQVDRGHGNLALARRRLARAVRGDTGPAVVDTRGTPAIEAAQLSVVPAIEPRPATIALPIGPGPSAPPVVPGPRTADAQPLPLPLPRAAPEPHAWRRTTLVDPPTVPPPAAPEPAAPSHDLFTPVTPTRPLGPVTDTGPPPGPVYTLERLPAAGSERTALPRRHPGASAPPPAPRADAAPAQGTARGAHRERSEAAVSRWRRDQGTLRRLLVGLRRLA